MAASVKWDGWNPRRYGATVEHADVPPAGEGLAAGEQLRLYEEAGRSRGSGQSWSLWGWIAHGVWHRRNLYPVQRDLKACIPRQGRIGASVVGSRDGVKDNR